MIYADTSILVGLYVPEPKSDTFQTALSKAQGVIISGLTEVEFHSAIARRVRMKEIPRSDGHRVIAQFQLHIKDRVFPLVALGPREYELARDWIAAMDTPLRTLDALHLAAAFTHSLELVTADQALAKSARKLGIKAKTL